MAVCLAISENVQNCSFEEPRMSVTTANSKEKSKMLRICLVHTTDCFNSENDESM